MPDEYTDKLAKALIKTTTGNDFMLGSDEGLLANIYWWISTGCWPLDAVIGGNASGQGIPGGRLIELYGDESTGKSLLALGIIAQCQQAGGVALLLDSEMTNTANFMAAMGVDVDNLLVAYPNTIEEVYEAIDKFLGAKGAIDKEAGHMIPAVIVWDSVASTSAVIETESIKKSGLSKMDVAPHARQMSKMLRMLPRQLSRVGVTGIFVNQTRQNIGVAFGDKVATSGGKALKFYTSLRLRLTVTGKYKVAGEIVGINVRATVVKSKVDRPLGRCEFPIVFGSGVDNVMACFNYLKAVDVIKTRGSWHYIDISGDEVKFRTIEWHRVYQGNIEYIRNLVLYGEIVYTDDVKTVETDDADVSG